MSIVVLNDLVLELTDEGQKINRQICLFYLILNFVMTQYELLLISNQKIIPIS